MINKILIADTFKKFEGKEWQRIDTFVSYNINKLKLKIEEKYKIELTKDPNDEFPYFTDGGFKYQCKIGNFEFMTTAHLFDII